MPKWLKTVAVVLVVVIGLLWYVKLNNKRPRDVRVVFFDIGQGDAALIEFASGARMLVDCGPDKTILSKLGKTLPFYDRRIDYLVATHPDLDHYGGCVDVLKRYNVKNIVTNGMTKDSDPYWITWDRAAREEGAEAVVINGRELWNFGTATMEFFSPDESLRFAAPPGDGNNYSIVFRLATPSTSIFFAGDMEMPLEEALLERYCKNDSFPCSALAAKIFKAGHHGSDSSTSNELLRAVSPDKAIISSGRNNRYGHPSLRVVKRLQRAGAEILRTDEIGDIIIEN